MLIGCGALSCGRHTARGGRELYAIGSNPEAARPLAQSDPRNAGGGRQSGNARQPDRARDKAHDHRLGERGIDLEALHAAFSIYDYRHQAGAGRKIDSIQPGAQTLDVEALQVDVRR